MDSSKKEEEEEEVDHEFLPCLRVYKDGRVKRLLDTTLVPPSIDSPTGVSSKDVVIDPKAGLSARLYLPTSALQADPKLRLPLIVYIHGGGFCISSPFSSKYHPYVNSLVSQANVIAVSVSYRLAPEHPLPAAYHDCWAALQWVSSHINIGTQSHEGPANNYEPWLAQHADFTRVFLAGDSAGANIVHNMAILAGKHKEIEAEEEEEGFGVGGLTMRILGIALVHPYFWGSEPIGSEGLNPERKALVDRLWPYVSPSTPSNDDPRVNPMADEGARSRLSRLGCSRVLVCVAEKDVLRDRGWAYYEELSKCGWVGVAEIMETQGEDHAFHLFNLTTVNATQLIHRLAAFFNMGDIPFSY